MTSNEDDPHGVTLERYALIEARLSEGDVSANDLLRERGLTESAWIDVVRHWTARMVEDVQVNGLEATLPHLYSAAFAKAQDAFRPPPHETPEGYAKLVAEIQREGGPEKPLARRRWTNADYLRLSRAMSKRLTTDPAAAAEFGRTFEDETGAAEQS